MGWLVACGPGDGASQDGDGGTGTDESGAIATSTEGGDGASGAVSVTGTTGGSTGDMAESSGGGDSTGTDDPTTGTDDSGGSTDAALVLYVNFDGADLDAGADDAPANTTQIGEMTTPLQPFGNGPKRDAVLARVIEHWAPYDVVVTDTAPSRGPYTMAVVTPTNPFGGGVQGISPLDCGDVLPSNVVFAFGSEAGEANAEAVANSVSRQVGAAVGLTHVDAPGDVMNAFGSDAPATFTDECAPLSSGDQCATPPAPGCGAGTQNSHAYLLDRFGAAP